MKKGWQTKKLAEVCDVKHGYAFDGQEFSSDVPEGNPLVITPGNFTEDGKLLFNERNTKRFSGTPPTAFRFDIGDLVVVMTDLSSKMKILGKPAFIETDDVLHNQRIGRVKFLNDGIDKRFVYYFMMSDRYLQSIKISATGTMVKHTAPGRILDNEILLPPLAEQQRIVGLLDEAFEGLATAKANAEKNLQNARALFESHLQSVFTQRGLGWVDTALGGVCGFVRGPFGGSLKKSIFVADGYAVYEQQHAIYDQFDDVRYFIDEAKFKEMKRFELLPDDLIMSCSGTMGRVAIVPKDIKRGIINQALLKLTPSSKILNTFLKSWMESEAFQDALKEYSGGAAIQNVASVKILKEIKVPLPSMSDQKRVVEELDDLREETQRLARLYERKHAALEALKKSLLHQAFTGAL